MRLSLPGISRSESGPNWAANNGGGSLMVDDWRVVGFLAVAGPMDNSLDSSNSCSLTCGGAGPSSGVATAVKTRKSSSR